MRTDAQRNVQRILEAARDLVVERGADVPLEAIARATGVGIGTLYRRFPDRQALLTALVLHALEGTTAAARAAAQDEADAGDALARYLQQALELRVSALIPDALGVLDLEEPSLAAARAESVQAVEELVDAAHDSGALAADVGFSDLATMLVRIAQPRPGALPQEVEDNIGRRHLAILLRCLVRTTEQDSPTPLPGTALSLQDLHVRGRQGA